MIPLKKSDFYKKKTFWGEPMKEYDSVELIVDREEYNKEGVYKGMFGTIMCEHSIDGTWLVIFSEFHTAKIIADIDVREEDLKMYDKIPPEKIPPRKESDLDEMLSKTTGRRVLNGKIFWDEPI